MTTSHTSLQYSAYHSILRIALVVCAVVLVFVSGIVSSTTAILTQATITNTANVIGMSVSVPPNEINQVTAKLTEKQQQLEAREAAIREREISLGLAAGEGGPNDRLTYILSGLLFILLVLIVLNYALDFSRQRRQLQPNPF